eukprot:scaffold202302_cov30-Tisochrysis_lutea.AAC.2
MPPDKARTSRADLPDVRWGKTCADSGSPWWCARRAVGAVGAPWTASERRVPKGARLDWRVPLRA